MTSFNYDANILLSRWIGRFGNRMFCYAFGMDYAIRNDLTLLIPSIWEGSFLFKKSRVALIPDEELRLKLIHSARYREKAERRIEIVDQHMVRRGAKLRYLDPDRDFDLEEGGVFYEKMAVQNEGVFKNYTHDRLRKIFEWSDVVKGSDLFKTCEDAQGTYVVAHLRRGDIADIKRNRVRATGYSVLSQASYLKAFQRFGVDPDSVNWITDDRTGKWGEVSDKKRFAGWKYPEGSKLLPDGSFDWLEDFLKIYFAGKVFRANSSFSWWASCLSPCAQTYSPVLPRRKLYLEEGDEVAVEFVEGNEPHWINASSGSDIKKIVID